MRELFLGLGVCSARQNGQERGLKGYGGVFIPLHPEYSRWGPGISLETPSQQGFDALDQCPHTPGSKTGESEFGSIFHSSNDLVWFSWLTKFCLGSLEH